MSWFNHEYQSALFPDLQKLNSKSIVSQSLSAKYTPLFANPKGQERRTALQIIQDEGLVGKLAGKVFVVTSCSNGIGIETARALSATGATLFLTVQNVKTSQEALKDILEREGCGSRHSEPHQRAERLGLQCRNNGHILRYHG
jgi:hypothetical protein